MVVAHGVLLRPISDGLNKLPQLELPVGPVALFRIKKSFYLQTQIRRYVGIYTKSDINPVSHTSKTDCLLLDDILDISAHG